MRPEENLKAFGKYWFNWMLASRMINDSAYIAKESQAYFRMLFFLSLQDHAALVHLNAICGTHTGLVTAAPQ